MYYISQMNNNETKLNTLIANIKNLQLETGAQSDIHIVYENYKRGMLMIQEAKNQINNLQNQIEDIQEIEVQYDIKSLQEMINIISPKYCNLKEILFVIAHLKTMKQKSLSKTQIYDNLQEDVLNTTIANDFNV